MHGIQHNPFARQVGGTGGTFIGIAGLNFDCLPHPVSNSAKLSCPLPLVEAVVFWRLFRALGSRQQLLPEANSILSRPKFSVGAFHGVASLQYPHLHPSQLQVEQLKNIVQSLSHASSREETQGWGQGSATTRTQGTVDLDPLLRDVPGVDPSVLLLLHRTPWADVVLEGIRKEEACFEWQGKDR